MLLNEYWTKKDDINHKVELINIYIWSIFFISVRKDKYKPPIGRVKYVRPTKSFNLDFNVPSFTYPTDSDQSS